MSWTGVDPKSSHSSPPPPQLGAMALVWDRYAGASVSEYKRGVTACGLDFSVSGCRDWSFSAPW